MKLKFKKLLLVLFSAIMVISIVGCQSSSNEKVNDIPVEELSETILNTKELEYGMLFPASEEVLKDTIGLDFDKLEEYSLSEPVNIQSSTLYIAKTKENKDVDDVKKAFESKLKLIQQSFEQYLPDQYDLSLNGKVVTKGNYVMLVICKDTDKAIDTLNTKLTV